MEKKKVCLGILLVFVLCLGTFSLLQPGYSRGAEQIKGPADLHGANNVKNSPYYPSLDYYNMQSKGSLVILPKFATLQQTTEYSCGPGAALMVIKYFNKDATVTEAELCKTMMTSTVNGTTTKGMLKYFSKDKWQVESSVGNKTPQTDVEFKSFVLNHLRNNMPILVENIDWGGHWRVIIGYDDMGSPENIADDVLILADPYDTTDHNQDGYGVVPAQRFFYMWFDAKLFPSGDREKPWLSVKPL